MARKRARSADSGYTILVVDDQEETLLSVQRLLEREGHHVLLADGGQRALDLFAQHDVHLLLVDYFMPRMTGEELVAEIRKIDSQVQIVLQTGYAGEKPPREMLQKLAIQGYHDKSEGPDKLLLWIEVAIKSYEQLRRVREAELLKSQLLANISHEFRTPLHIILGYTQILREEHGGAPSGGSDTLDRIHQNAEMLLRLVDDFLSLSDLDAGITWANAIAVVGESLEQEFARSATILIREKPIRFEWRVTEALPPVAADAAKLRVIVMNLLSNAVKFTTAGVIAVSAEVEPDGVVLAIRDSGMGIAAEDHDRIFEPFRQVDGSSTRTQAGTGIGLPIARKLARLMGGNVTVDSTLGEGATFFLHLRRAATSAPASAAPERMLRVVAR
ncbi:MAG TPA: hybrid sensor histidine kinase/response regulator [Candidatus Binatia bacterium]|jgi:signal transduction histidine kinase